MAELLHGENLSKLLQRSHAAWQADVGIRKVLHSSLALRHGFHHFKAGQARMRELQIHQLLRDHAGYASAVGEAGVCHDTHQPHVAAAINQVQTAVCQLLPQLPGCLTISFRVTCGRSAIHRN